MSSKSLSRHLFYWIDPLSVWFLICLLLPAWGVRGVLLWREPLWDSRILKGVSLGFSYDVMNAMALAFVVAIIPFPRRLRKLFAGLLGFVVLWFLFTDYHYVLQFGTHLPFSTIEYVKESHHFRTTAYETLLSPSLLLVVILPFLALVFGLMKEVSLKSVRQILIQRTISVFMFLLIGGVCGNYSNSYVAKNLEDPLVSAGLNYFFWTYGREDAVRIEFPERALSLVKETLNGEVPPQTVYANYPLVRQHHRSSCKNPSTELARELCAEFSRLPNILIILLESFRAAEVGVLGSSLQLTPKFDDWSRKGILFTNFFANGFQTRHGEVAIYCSMMPNYGAPIMKRYSQLSFLCLPEMLHELGYHTSWLFPSDSSFDSQTDFFQRNGFARIIDRFDFPKKSEELGWGYSDEALYQKWLHELREFPEPFFSSALTITNHHPFKVPEAFELGFGNDDLHRYYNAMFYTDAQLGAFLEAASIEDWYSNSLILVTADTSNFQQSQSPPENFEELVRIRSRIPLLLVGGLVERSLVVEDYVSQIDLAPTLMDLIGVDWQAPWAGHSLLSRRTNSVAFTNRPGSYWAVMSSEGRYYRENDRFDHAFGWNESEGFLQHKELGEAWIKTTYWLLQEDLYWLR